MVQGIPYVHWKINRESINYDNVDTNYLWATVVESNKGPINTPVLCGSNLDVLNLFGVDLGAYFAQGAEYLVVVRAAAQSDNHKLEYARAAITNSEAFEYKKVIQPYYVTEDTYGFISYGDSEGLQQYAEGTVKVTGVTSGENTQVQVIQQDAFEEEFKNKKFFVPSNAQAGNIYQLTASNPDNTMGDLENIWIQITSHTSSFNNGVKKYVANSEPRIYVNLDENSLYKKCDPDTGVITDNITVYPASDVIDLKEVETKSIEPTPLIELQARYPGNYVINLHLIKNLTYNGYNLTLTEEGAGHVSINNAIDLESIVNTINNANISVIASLTDAGKEIVSVMNSKPVLAQPPYTDVAVGQILIDEGETKYSVKLTELTNNFTFNNGSNGEWDEVNNRISSAYATLAHREALNTLKSTKIAGVFCLYGEDEIQREYLLHGYNPDNEYDGVNSNLVCKWRYILLGANAYDRSDIYTLKQKAQSINNQYVLFLGQGLIESGKKLLPYECVPYIAGLRARLNYGDAIFGGQPKKQIRPVGTSLKIAQLFSYEDEKTMFIWDPLIYEDLNEAGVLTFTNEYGRLTLTDGVTTAVQSLEQESEEGVVNILKYIQNGVQNLCLSYIGRNINSDLEAALEMNIKSFLQIMVAQDQTLIELPNENISAYEVDVVMSPNSTQVVGKIYVYLKVTPVHALRQIEVEMTVQ